MAAEEMSERKNQNVYRSSTAAFEVLRRRVRVVIGFTVFVAIAAVAFSFLESKYYASSASVRIDDPTLDQLPAAKQPFAGDDEAAAVVESLRIQSLGPVAELAAEYLGKDFSGPEVTEMVEVGIEEEPFRVNAKVVSADAGIAAATANAFVRAYLRIRELADAQKIADALSPLEERYAALGPRRKVADTGQRMRMTINRLVSLRRLLQSEDLGELALAQPATSYANASAVPNLLGGGFLGLLLGISTALLMERQDRRKITSTPDD